MESEDARPVGVLAVVHGIVHATFLSIPVLLPLWGAEFNLGPLEQATEAAVAYAAFGLGSLPFGARADRVGAAGQLRTSAARIVVALLGIAASPNRWLLALALAALGIAASAYHPSALALLSRTVRRTGWAMGWHGMGGSVGIAAGPALAVAILATGASWRFVPATLALVAVAGLGLLVLGRVRDASPAKTVPRETGTLWTHGFLAVVGVYAFAGVAYWGSLSFLPRFFGSEITGGSLYAAGLAAGAIGQVAFGYAAERGRPEPVLIAASAAAGGVLASLPWISPTAWLGAVPAFGLLLFGLEPLQNVLVTSRVPPAWRGRAFGVTFLAVFGVGSIGALVAGAFLGAGLSFGALFAVLMACLVASGVLGYASGRR